MKTEFASPFPYHFILSSCLNLKFPFVLVKNYLFPYLFILSLWLNLKFSFVLVKSFDKPNSPALRLIAKPFDPSMFSLETLVNDTCYVHCATDEYLNCTHFTPDHF